MNYENLNTKKGNNKRQMHMFKNKDDNVPPKFVVPIESVTLKDCNSCQIGLKNIILKIMEYMEYMKKKEIHNYGIDLNK